jgi:hypothetical protein
MLFQFETMLKTLKYCILTTKCSLRPPGQRLPSQSRLMTYRIACKLHMLDNEEPDVIHMCASAIIEVLKAT